MIEILFYGRAGQGGKTASELLADTALDEGKFIQAFPEYGPEREGAPVKAFTRINEKPVRIHCHVKEPDMMIILDETLVTCPEDVGSLKPEGLLIMNTKKSPEEIRKETKFKGKVYTVDAKGISIDIFKKNIPNTPMLGALLKATGIVKMKSLEYQVYCRLFSKFGKDIFDKNMQAIKKAYEEAGTDGED